jgi:ABC-2 type transport system permease protein
MYSLMITLAATSIWLGRNQTLYDFWFYITNFSRYPREIYAGKWGYPLQWSFTYLIPVLVVVNVPARIIARPVREAGFAEWYLPAFAVLATLISFAVSRWVFQRSLYSYRSASS